MEPTQKLYEEDAFLARFTARVLACEARGGAWRAALDRTAFYPEGGGQPCDTGRLGGAAVLDVRAEGAVVWHTLDAALPAGAQVEGLIDWDRRLDHMEQHTGEHILSGCLYRMYGAANVGFHIGQPAVRMDLDRPLTAEQLAQAERAANQAVRADTPVLCTVPDAAVLAATEYRSKKTLEGPVRLVEAGGDRCACCGTHLARTGQVGLIKILSAQPYKGGVRLAVACGQRAWAAVDAAWSDAEAAGRILSAGPGRLARAAATLHEQRGQDRQRLAALQRQLLQAAAQSAMPGRPAVRVVEGLDADGVRRLARALADSAGAFGAALSPVPQPPAVLYALASPPGRDARGPAGALNEAFAGRGGGKAALCQGTLPARADAADACADAAAAWLEELWKEGD